MKTVTVTFPIQEAVEALRLLRGESRCLIEQTEFAPDFDTTKRINHVLSEIRTHFLDILDKNY